MFVIFTFFAVMVVTAVLFGGWVIMSIFRLIGRAVGGVSNSSTLGNASRHCSNPSCRTVNPRHANYCRRCGAPMDQTITAAFRGGMPTQQFNPPNSQARQVARA